MLSVQHMYCNIAVFCCPMSYTTAPYFMVDLTNGVYVIRYSLVGCVLSSLSWSLKWILPPYHLHYCTGKHIIICCQIFCDLLLKSAFERIFNIMQLILVKIKWNIKWKYLIQKFHDICLSYYFKKRVVRTKLDYVFIIRVL